MANSIAHKLEDGSFRGWYVNDQPYVKSKNFGGVEEMLDELNRRLRKSGRLKEYEQNQRYTKPSKQRRIEEEAQAHRAEIGEVARWRGGVEP
jgi:ribosomal protein S21